MIATMVVNVSFYIYIYIWEGTVVAASFLTIVVKFLINHELFHWETYTF